MKFTALAFLFLFFFSPLAASDNPGTALINVYKNSISQAHGYPCPMHPSCSTYGLDCFRHHDPVTASLKTIDRINRCGNDMGNYTRVLVNGEPRYLDPAVSSQPKDYLGINERIAMLKRQEKATEAADASPGQFAGDDERLLLFARHFQTANDHQRAVTEFERLLFYYPQSPLRNQSLIGLMISRGSLKDYQGMMACTNQLVNPTAAEVFRTAILTSEMLISQNCPETGRQILAGIPTGHENMQNEIRLVRGVSFARQYRWNDALLSFQSVNDRPEHQELKTRYLELSRQGLKLEEKNPVLAGILAIIPGLGYLYDGHPVTALSAFAVNALLGWGTYEAFRQNNLPMGILMASATAGWYSGNIYGSVVTAQKFNEKQNQDLAVQFSLGF